MIKVVHITENPIAGAPMNLSKALNKYQGDQVHSRHIAASDHNESRVYDSDLLVGKKDYAEICKVMREADIFHFHNFYSKQELFRQWPALWWVCQKKPRVWQAHSQRSITWMDITEGLRDPQAKHLVIGQYHPRQWPECTVVPNVIDIFDPALMPVARDWSKQLSVCFSPSRVGLTGWDSKGYDETYPTLLKLFQQGVLKFQIVRDRPYRECLDIRGQCHIGIDEIVTGSYHLCSLEALSQGLLTIAGLDETQLRTLGELTGSDNLPWVIAKPNTLETVLKDAARNPQVSHTVANMGREWMEKYWHPKDMTQRFVDIYKEM